MRFRLERGIILTFLGAGTGWIDTYLQGIKGLETFERVGEEFQTLNVYELGSVGLPHC